MNVNQIIRLNGKLAIVTRVANDEFKLSEAVFIGGTIPRCILSVDTVELTDMTFNEAVDKVNGVA